nr:hypothetical protein CFP56_30882 [Quercus suber]
MSYEQVIDSIPLYSFLRLSAVLWGVMRTAVRWHTTRRWSSSRQLPFRVKPHRRSVATTNDDVKKSSDAAAMSEVTVIARRMTL